MCIVIDANVLSCVLDPTNQQHDDFKPVLDWIVYGKGKIVYGGTTLGVEMFVKIKRFNRLILELKKVHKVVEAPRESVDAEEKRIRLEEPDPSFDDPHIVAVIDVTGCRLLCSNDSRSDRYIKQISLYRKFSPPKIYRNRRHHTDLLCDANIASCALPAVKLSAPERDSIGSVLGSR